jgi:hypothetical protein
MVRMISEARHVYAGRELKPGDEFDCEPLHVQLMTVLGRARKLESKQRQVYRTRDMRAKRMKT